MARLVLLPGLGADERLFAGLGELCLSVVRSCLPVPETRESLTAYALRVAAQLELRPEDWLGGASFGSLVAADIARRRPLAGLVLIGGALSSDTLVAPLPWLARLRHLLPIRVLRPLAATRTLLTLGFGALAEPHRQVLTDMLNAAPEALLREGLRLVTGYRPAVRPLCPVYAIHGDLDRMMHAPPLPACRRVADAGHALALTHPQLVTEFLRATICDAR
jgi:pimeloyl-ACP methyl ester carboxylesterase